MTNKKPAAATNNGCHLNPAASVMFTRMMLLLISTFYEAIEYSIYKSHEIEQWLQKNI